MFTPLSFQKDTIDTLKEKFVRLWARNSRQLPLVLKSPTGSGKTFVMAHFINELNHLPNWDYDKAYIWITFSDDLAMQSRDKFKDYFQNTLKNELLTVNDFKKSKLSKNDILFINWQKLVSRAAENRVLRRPEEIELQKEQGYYFEDFVENTHNEGREIILIVDEAHTHVTTDLAEVIIKKINPKIIIKVTATPKNSDELQARRVDGFVAVERERVVDEGLIKEKIAVQTDEDLQKHSGEDLDKVLLDLGLDKRFELKNQFNELGKADINPLMMIQLPNDDKELQERGDKTKEEIVLDYLKEKGIDKNRIALWFDKHKKNLDFISENDSDVDYLLFKQAAGTGWDCPRAHILVMFREISSPTFYVQTVGRILRMAEPDKKEDYNNSPDLRTGFLFTNYRRNEVRIPDQSPQNKPYTYTAQLKDELKNVVKDFELKSAYLSRIDYGDLADSAKFQASFVKSMDKYFGLTVDDILGKSQEKIKAKGINLNPKITNKLVVNAEFEDLDQLVLDFAKKGTETIFEISQNDIEKTFNYLCYSILKEQTDEDAKITNIARSWSPLKSGIRVWLKQIFSDNSDVFYRIFIYDVLKNTGSKFKSAITNALKDYRPVLNKILKERHKKEEEKETPVFKFKNKYLFTDDYKEIEQKLCVLDKSYLRIELMDKVNANEERFIKYIDSKKDFIKWWFKNGDSGKDYYCLKYDNTNDKKTRLFYPDWIIKFIDGRTWYF